MPEDIPFWQLALSQLSPAQWEALCDGCGKCCLIRLQDEDSNEIHNTNIVCDLFRLHDCRCSDYSHRSQRVPDCLTLDLPLLENDVSWLPRSCSYRLRAESRPLPEWHPLRTGDPESPHRAGRSVLGRVIHQNQAGDPQHHLVDWD